MILPLSWLLTFSSIGVAILGSWIAFRLPWLKKRPVATGIWFGILSIITLFITGTADIPVFISALFAGSVPGFISGVIAALTRVLLTIDALSLPERCICAAATLIGTFFITILRRWGFENKNPSLVPAVIGAAFATMLHLSIHVMFSFGEIPTIYLASPFILGEALLPILAVSLFQGGWKGWKKTFFATDSAAFFSFAIAVCLIFTTAIHSAAELTDANVTWALKALQENIEGQIGFMLHCNATLLVQRIGSPKAISDQEIRKLANDYDIDELNIKAADGHTLASNDPRVKNGKKFSRNDEKTRPYFDLINEKSDFVQQRFRRGINNPEVIAKYIALPFPRRDGFLQTGYTWDHLGRTFEAYFFPSLTELPIKKSGFFLVTDAKGKIVVPVHRHPEALGKNVSEIGLPPAKLITNPGELFYERIFNAWCRCGSFKAIGRWRILAVMPLAEDLKIAVSITTVACVILFFIGLTFRMILNHFVRTRAKIDQLREAEEKRREEDLSLARMIQTSELKADVPNTQFYCAHAIMTPAKEVGGDFYDYYELDDAHLVITIADVSGKGVPAAIFMMKAKISLKEAILRSNNLTDAVHAVNRKLCAQNDSLMFVTAWVGILDLRTGQLEYISAGHNPPLFLYADHSVEWIKGKRALALGVSEKAKYASQTCLLHPGDQIILYTDGVTEAMNPQRELYGEERLYALLEHTSSQIIPALHADLLHFMAQAPQADDITILTIQYLDE